MSEDGERPRKPPDPLRPAAVVEGAKRAIHGPDPNPAFTELVEKVRQEIVRTPPNDFGDGVRADKHWRENVCPNGEQPLGPYIPPQHHSIRSLEQKAELVEFLPHHIALFETLTPGPARALGRFAVRLAERQTVTAWWKWACGMVVAIAVPTFATARWGVDQFEWIRNLVNLFRGHAP